MQPMTEDDIDRIAKRMLDLVRDESSIYFVPAKRHQEEHDFIREWIRQRAERHAMWKRIRESLIGWLLIGVVAGFLTMVGTAAYDGFRKAVRQAQHETAEKPSVGG